MEDVVRRTSRLRRWKTWAGDAKELHAIANIFQQAADAMQQEALDAHKAHEGEVDYCDCLSTAKRTKAVAYLSEGGESLSGPLHSVVGSIDRRTFQSLTFELEPDGYSSKLSLHLTNFGTSGVTLRVSSTNQRWLRQTVSELSDEIDKGVPKWHFYRSPPGLFLIALLGLLTGLAIGIPLISDRNAIGIYPPAILPIIAPLAAYYWAFPGFEITHEGATTTGARRIGFIAALLLSFPVGALVNWLT